jgi:hypothetical protein
MFAVVASTTHAGLFATEQAKGLRLVRIVGATIVGLALAVSAPHTAWAAGASVDRVGACFLENGDIPGLPGFPLSNHTVIVGPKGTLIVTCSGRVPDGVSVSSTFVGTLACDSDTGVIVPGHVVVTTSGRVSLACRFPQGTIPV